MASVVQSGEGAAGHTSTQQWQSFEMRMRQRRIERLLLRAQVAQEAGSADEVDEALAEAEQLNPSEPRIAELRARFSAAAASRAAVPAAVEPARPLGSNATPDVGRDSDLLEVNELALLEAAPFVDLPLLQTAAVDEFQAAQPDRVPIRRRRNGLMAAAAVLLLILAAPFIWMAARDFSIPRTTRAAEGRDTIPQNPPAEAAPANANQPAAQEPEVPVKIAVDEIPLSGTALTRTETAAQANLLQPLQTPPASVDRIAAPAPDVATLPTPPALTPPSSAIVERAPGAPVATAPPPAPTPTVPPLTESTPATLPHEPVSPLPPPEASPSPAVAHDDARIRAVLASYESAYSRLDADAAVAFWPGVDRRALGRAFEGLASQRVTLGSCDVRIAGETAIADCSGSATWTPKVGGGNHTQDRRWQFRLRNASGDWQIVAAKVR